MTWPSRSLEPALGSLGILPLGWPALALRKSPAGRFRFSLLTYIEPSARLEWPKPGAFWCRPEIFR